MKNNYCIILAAGEGKRMGTEKRGIPKALEVLKGQPFIDHALDLAKQVGFSKSHIIVVVGHRQKQVIDRIAGRAVTVIQDIKTSKGTAMAVNSALPKISTQSTVLIMNVDQCFYSPQIAIDLIQDHFSQKAEMTIMSVKVQDPTGLGRIIRNSHNKFQAIIEEKDTSISQKKITEINTGTYVFNTSFLNKYLPQVTPNPISGEYYLTDLAKIGLEDHQTIHICTKRDFWAGVGINTPEELTSVQKVAKE